MSNKSDQNLPSIIQYLQDSGYTKKEVSEQIISIQVILPEAIDPADPQYITEVKSGIRFLNILRKAFRIKH